MSAEQSIQYRPALKGVGDGFGFDSAGGIVPTTDFNFDALEAERRDHAADVAYYRDKLAEFVRFTCEALLSGNPSAETAGRRAYFFAHLLNQSPFSTQTELADHLGVSKVTVSQQLNSFAQKNPLFSMASSRQEDV